MFDNNCTSTSNGHSQTTRDLPTFSPSSDRCLHDMLEPDLPVWAKCSKPPPKAATKLGTAWRMWLANKVIQNYNVYSCSYSLVHQSPFKTKYKIHYTLHTIKQAKCHSRIHFLTTKRQAGVLEQKWYWSPWRPRSAASKVHAKQRTIWELSAFQR